MNKVAATYWNNGYAVRKSTRTRHTKTVKASVNSTPHWFIFTVITVFGLLLCLAINFRAFSDARQELTNNEQYRQKVENLTTENLALQQEIHTIKTDEKTVEREASKIGLFRPER